MKKIIFFMVAVFFIQTINAQTIINRDPEIDQMVKEISSDSLKMYINKLVSFWIPSHHEFHNG